MIITRRQFTAAAALAAALAARPLSAWGSGQEPQTPPDPGSAAMFLNFEDLRWEKILPEFAEGSPEICMLHVEPRTQASELLIRVPAGFHVPRHWHSANETHTVVKGTCTFECADGKRATQGPGSFNYIPSRMVHQAWIGDEGMLVFITVDGAWDINWLDGPPKPTKP